MWRRFLKSVGWNYHKELKCPKCGFVDTYPDTETTHECCECHNLFGG